MSDSGRSFAELLEQARGGSDAAVVELLDRYGPHVLRVVRKAMSHRLRSKFDSSDFVQAVWASFFVHRQQVDRFSSPEQFVAFLAAMARHKVVDEYRRRVHTQKYDVTRERSLDDNSAVSDANIRARTPTPSQVAQAHERWDALVEGRPPRDQEILRLRCDGFNYDEIGRRLGVNERTVRRVFERLLRDQEA